MDWEAIGAVGDFIGGAAVVVTLVFLLVQLRQLSAQTRQHTLAIRFSSYSAHATNLANFQHGTALNSELSKIMLDGSRAPEYRDKSLDDVAWYRYGLALRSIFTIFQDLHEQYEHGLIDSAYWDNNINWLKQLVSTSPAIKGWWEAETAAGAYIPAFVDAINSFEAYSPGEYLYRASPSASSPPHR